MRFKYRFKSLLQFIAFAFNPKVTLVWCTILSVLSVVILFLIMNRIEKDSGLYDILFTITTGVIASFFVSVIVELTSNYKHNRLAWEELKDYYDIVVDYEGMKQVLMGNTPEFRETKRALDDFINEMYTTNRMTNELLEELKMENEQYKDVVEATWEQLHKVIPVLRHAYDTKKAFLNTKEIQFIGCILDDYKVIRHRVKKYLQMAPMLYDVVNTPDEEYLDYPQNVIDDMLDILRKRLAAVQGTRALDRLTDEVMSDDIMLSMIMESYNISEMGIVEYERNNRLEEKVDSEDKEDDGINNNQMGNEETVENDFWELEDPEEHREYHIQVDKEFSEENKPFDSWCISIYCKRIAGYIDELERIILKKPYYGIYLKFEKDALRQDKDIMSENAYEREMERLKKLYCNQEK